MLIRKNIILLTFLPVLRLLVPLPVAQQKVTRQFDLASSSREPMYYNVLSLNQLLSFTGTKQPDDWEQELQNTLDSYEVVNDVDINDTDLERELITEPQPQVKKI